jgi:signal peptidase I
LSSKSRVFDGGAVSGKISGDQNQLAGMWRRAGSLLIDSVLIALIVKVLTALGLVVLLLFSELPAAPSPLAMGAVLLFLLLLYLVVPAGYYMYFWTTSGRTTGKRLLGLRVVQIDGSPVSLRTATLRLIGFYISGFVFGIGLICAAFDPKRQGWHDKFAYTQVVQVTRVGAVSIVFASIILIIAGSLSISAVLIQTGTQNFKVKGPSMSPALVHGQYFLINKLVYKFGDPEQGDVIVFRFPMDPNRLFGKRIIGVPGDRISIKEGTVWVNGAALSEPYVTAHDTSNMSERKMGRKEYFVLGDNRPGSSDSRLGWNVPEENILGKMWITYYSP